MDADREWATAPPGAGGRWDIDDELRPDHRWTGRAAGLAMRPGRAERIILRVEDGIGATSTGPARGM